MKPVLTAAAMRALEREAIDSGLVTGAELMKRAGKGVVAALLARWPEAARMPQRALVLCGPGNNGGDGFVVARQLRRRGWDVRVALMGDPARAPADAAAMRQRFTGGMTPCRRCRIGGIPPLSRPFSDGWRRPGRDGPATSSMRCSAPACRAGSPGRAGRMT
ncbi:YjeF-related protein [Rubellimicrobium thermophilum DSM 16684]|uniref:YjeF-related protein n=1 Tax=Rubellimicrobium thermophilum DSM 16684 TaxID=1123069 RepID=S9SLG4_9RHOB|nr:YjeF-related protein [Rubellimicrobium thermophilum DSM 16684]